MGAEPVGDGLTENQARFCREYAADRNATQAYLRAFPHVAYNTARTEGPRLLANPAVRAAVARARADHARAARVSAVRVLRELAAVAFADPGDVLEPDGPGNGGLPVPRNWSDLSPAARRAVAGVKVKRRRLRGAKGDTTSWEVEEVEFRHHPKVDALRLLCDHLGLTGRPKAVEDLLARLAAVAAGGPTSVPPAESGAAGAG